MVKAIILQLLKKMLEDLSGESMNPSKAYRAIQWAVNHGLIKKSCQRTLSKKGRLTHANTTGLPATRCRISLQT